MSRLVSGSWTGEQYDLVRPDRGASRAALEGWISYEQAENLFNSVDLNLNTLKSAAAVQGFTAVTLPEVTLNATINQDVKTTTSRNVAGGITGTTYPDEYVTAEESGLLGSAYYAEDPLVPLEKTVAGVNIDGIQPIGRTKDMKVIGFGASELEDRLKAVLEPRDMYVVPVLAMTTSPMA